MMAHSGGVVIAALTSCVSDVDKALSTIDKVIAFHSLPEEVEGRIQEG